MAKRVQIAEGDWLKSLTEVEENLQEAVDNLVSTCSEGLAAAALYIAEGAQNRAPVDTGNLRGAVFVKLDGEQYAAGEEKGNGLVIHGEPPEGATKATIGFNARYAADQHEHTEYDHPKGGRSKYLESVLTDEKPRILSLIAQNLFGGDDDA